MEPSHSDGLLVSQEPTAMPIAGWISAGFSLSALGSVLWYIVNHDLLEVLKLESSDDPLLLIAMGLGIAGSLSGVIALLRKEPRHIAVTGLVVGLCAVMAKFVVGIVVVALALALIAAVMSLLT